MYLQDGVPISFDFMLSSLVSLTCIVQLVELCEYQLHRANATHIDGLNTLSLD